MTGESTIQDVPVQAGDNFTDYNVTVLVKIIDEFGDFSLFQTTIRVGFIQKCFPLNLDLCFLLIWSFILNYRNFCEYIDNTTGEIGSDRCEHSWNLLR